MNSGVFCLYIMLAFSILFISGWGQRYVGESGINQKIWACLLLLIGVNTSLTLSIKTIQVNFSAFLLAFCVLVYFLFVPGIGTKFKLLLALTTVGSVIFTLMMVFPHEPVFYFLDEKYLYPLCSVCASYLFSRKPLLAAGSSVGGMIAAGVAVENMRTFPYTGMLSFGSQDLMEMIVITFALSFLMDKAVAGTEMFLLRISGNRSADLESDPT